ncbi:MAG: tail fiber protein [Pseudomonadota bacterium]
MCKPQGISLIGALLAAAASFSPLPALAGDQPFLGEIVCLPYNFAPKGWALAQGQLLSISQNTALFSLLGTSYGGDGRTTFALPDLRGRVIIKDGAGPGLTPHVVGETGGSESTVLVAANLPVHSHTFAPPAATSAGTLVSPANAVAAADASTKLYTTPASPGTAAMASGVTSPAGGGQPLNNMQPYLSLNCAIALQGVFPARP